MGNPFLDESAPTKAQFKHMSVSTLPASLKWNKFKFTLWQGGNDHKSKLILTHGYSDDEIAFQLESNEKNH